MKNIIIFPGQGYFDLELLKRKYIKDFCYEYGLQDVFEAANRNKENIFDAKYAQVLIVATEIAQYLEYTKNDKENNNVLIGYSLGEISSLLAAGVLDIKEGIEFVKERAKLSDEFYKNNLKKKYFVGKVPYEEGIEQELIENDFKVINFIPDFTKTKLSIIIIGKNREKIFNLMKQKRKGEPLENLHMSELTCPFHTELMEELKEKQKKAFRDKIKEFNSQNLEKVFCTRTATMYSTDMSKLELNDSLAEYLVSPIQTKRTLEYFEKTELKSKDILVTMGKIFINDCLKEQCEIVGLSGNVIDIDNLI